MEREIKMIQKTLLRFYYLGYAKLMVILLLGGYILPKMEALSHNTTLALNTISIALVLICIPLGLKFFKDKTKQLKSDVIDKQTRIFAYIRYSKILMVLLAFPGVFAGVSYYLLQDNTSLFCFFISFVALIFSKPTEVKLQKFFID